MAKLSQIGELVGLIISLPFKISNGQRRRTYKQIKKQLTVLSLF
ncbi:hypothetical protein [Tenacibaculum sp. 190524A02b]|uniref:Transposase n=1 Tax=Tenacibaculum vairaonense TaxID=3137860 RepID=A0ABP1FFG3_9FLAO